MDWAQLYIHPHILACGEPKSDNVGVGTLREITRGVRNMDHGTYCIAWKQREGNSE